jgi:type IV secretory pathway TraG/TraD family ATPase VirD4
LVTNPSDLIHMANVLEERQIVYFYLSAALESISVREIAKLALSNMHSALLDRMARKASPRQVYLFIDEFQKAAGENFQTIIQQGRSAGMSVILANQSLSDLKGDIDLRPTIQTNTGTKLYFSVTDPDEIKTLSFLSGQVMQAVGPDGEESISAGLGSTTSSL